MHNGPTHPADSASLSFAARRSSDRHFLSRPLADRPKWIPEPRHRCIPSAALPTIRTMKIRTPARRPTLSCCGASRAISAPRISPLTNPPPWQALSMPGEQRSEKNVKADEEEKTSECPLDRDSRHREFAQDRTMQSEPPLIRKSRLRPPRLRPQDSIPRSPSLPQRR